METAAVHKKFSIKEELKDMPPEVAERRDALHKLLMQYNMDIRDDSRLTHNYLVNGGDVYMIANELLCTNFLFQNTRYDNLCQDGLKYIANQIKEQYKLPWHIVWSITREYGVPAMKFYALAESGYSMPDFPLMPISDDMTTPPNSEVHSEAGTRLNTPTPTPPQQPESSLS